MRRYVLIMFAVAFFIMPASAQAFEIGVRGYYWFPDLSSSVRVDGGGVAGSKIDLDTDLGVGDESYPAVEAFAGIGRHHISVGYTEASYSGTKATARNLIFKGKTFPAGSSVVTDADLQMLDIEYQYDLLDLENILAGFSLGAIGKVKYMEGEFHLRGGGFDERETFEVPVPMVGLGLHLGILADLLEARARVAGMAYSGSTFYEGLVDISLTPLPFFDIHGGYKITKLDVDDVSDIYADLEFSGPYVGLTFSF